MTAGERGLVYAALQEDTYKRTRDERLKKERHKWADFTTLQVAHIVPSVVPPQARQRKGTVVATKTR